MLVGMHVRGPPSSRTMWFPPSRLSRILFDASGQKFDTVMSAIASNNERWGFFDVTLHLRRQAGQGQDAPELDVPAEQ